MPLNKVDVSVISSTCLTTHRIDPTKVAHMRSVQLHLVFISLFLTAVNFGAGIVFSRFRPAVAQKYRPVDKQTHRLERINYVSYLRLQML